jgi:hypothetical protein
MNSARSALVAAMFGLPLLFSLGCTPAPKNTPCSNNGDCEALGEGYSYCLQSRCVRCISASMCKSGELCIDGECQQR